MQNANVREIAGAQLLLDSAGGVGLNLSISGITRVGSTATANIPSHGLKSGDVITVTGSLQTEYNVSGTAITVTDANHFTFSVSGTPATPATGTMVASFPAISNIGMGVAIVQLTALATANTAEVQARVSKDAPWVLLKAYSNSDGNALYTVPAGYNQVRVARTAGTDPFQAWGQQAISNG